MPKKVTKLSEIKNPREEIVAQGNDLIRQARFSLSALEQNIIYFAMSKIKPDDKDFMHLNFTVAEFCEVCGIAAEDGNQGGHEYRRVKAAVKSVSDKSVWVKYPTGAEVLIRWFDTCVILPDTGEMSIIFSQSMKPYLLGLIERAKLGGEGYTQTMLLTYLALFSKYSKRIYEILKSYLYVKGNQEKLYRVTHVEYGLDELKRLVNAENYDRYPDFRRFVLETAAREINAVTDISISFEPIKTRHKTTGVRFTFHHKQIMDRFYAIKAAQEILS